MKKVILASLLLVGVAAMAQERNGKHRGNRTGDLTVEQMASLRTKRMVLALDLTDAQQAQVLELNLENAKIKKSRMDGRKAKKESGETKKTLFRGTLCDAK